MNHHDADITDVVVVFDCKGAETMESAAVTLKQMGMEICSVKNDEGVIEGSIDSDKVQQLKTVAGVCYVRSVFTYTADYPTGDPRDKDGPEPAIESDEGLNGLGRTKSLQNRKKLQKTPASARSGSGTIAM